MSFPRTNQLFSSFSLPVVKPPVAVDQSQESIGENAETIANSTAKGTVLVVYCREMSYHHVVLRSYHPIASSSGDCGWRYHWDISRVPFGSHGDETCSPFGTTTVNQWYDLACSRFSRYVWLLVRNIHRIAQVYARFVQSIGDRNRSIDRIQTGGIH